MWCATARLAVPGTGLLEEHAGVVKPDGLLHQREALWHRLDLGGAAGEGGRAVVCHRDIWACRVDPDTVPDLPAQQPVHRQPGGLARDVPQGHLDRAHCRTPGLEPAQPPDPQHHPLDLGRIFVNDELAVQRHHSSQVWARRLDLAVPAEPLVGDDAHHRVAANDRAAQVDDLHASIVLRTSLQFQDDN
jgi:hypothetical protein